MNPQTLFQTLDGFFQRGEYAQVEPFLREQLKAAEAAGDAATALAILNELAGFCRSTGRLAEAIEATAKALSLLEALGMQESVHYATTLLNAATAYRAQGDLAAALERFARIGALLTRLRVSDPHLLSSFHNNYALALQGGGEHRRAIVELETALGYVRGRPGAEADLAVTLTNLALSRLQCGELPAARQDLQEALQRFDALPRPNGHHSAALAALGELAWREGRTQEAVAQYERALAMIEARYGRNQDYAITQESLALVLEAQDPARAARLREEAQTLLKQLLG